MTNAHDSQNPHRPLELAVAICALAASVFVACAGLWLLWLGIQPGHQLIGNPEGAVAFFLGLIACVMGLLTAAPAWFVIRERRFGFLWLGVMLAFWTLAFFAAHRLGYVVLSGTGAAYMLARYSTR